MRNFDLALLLVLGGAPLFAQAPVLDSIQVLGGSSLDNVVSVTPDDAGNIFVLGYTQSPDFPATATFGTSTSAPSGGRDTFVAKIQLSDWSLVWATVFQPSVPLALAIDATGAVYVTGYVAASGTFPTTPGAFTTTTSQSGPTGPLFVAKLDPTGSLIVYSAMLTQYAWYTGAPIAVDSQGQAYVAASGTVPVTPGAAFPTGSRFVAKLSADGSKFIFCTYITEGGSATPNAIAIDNQQNVFVAGVDITYYSNFPATPGVVQSTPGGGDDAFVMKFSPDGTKLVFATLLGGAGGDSANFLQVGSDGSIYVAGYCEYGTDATAANPFPTTANAPFQIFNMFDGFVARLSSDATSLLFSTYVSNVSNSGVAGFAISGGQIYAAYPAIVSQGFSGLNIDVSASVQSTAMQAFDAGSGAATAAAFQMPALTPDAFTVTGTDLIVASNASQIDQPVPSTVSAIGPLGLDPNVNPLSESDITLARFLIGGTPDHEIDTDLGYFLFDIYPGAIPQQTLNVTSSAGASPFHIFGPLPDVCCQAVPLPFDISPQSGVTPAAIVVSATNGLGPYFSSPAALLLVSPHASQPIQLLPADTDVLSVQLNVPTVDLALPAGGGPASTTVQVSATAGFPGTGAVPVSVPFQFNAFSLPAFLDIDPLRGTTPATVNVTAQLDSLQPGGTYAEQIYVAGGDNQDQTVFVLLYRPAPAPLVSPTTVQLSAYLGQSPVTATLQVTPPDNTGFQVQSLPPGITVSPSSGTGPTTLTLTADPSQFSVGTNSVTFTVQVGTVPVSVTVSMSLRQNGSSFYNLPMNISLGLRATISVLGVAANLPATGSWSDVSPAPANWNGYSFVYRSYTLPILSANPSTLLFDIQFPYNLDLTGQQQPVTFVAPDGTVVSSASTYGREQPTAIAVFNSGTAYNTVLKSDGSVVSSANPVAPGDAIVIPIVGAGVTNPPIAAGLLPSPNTPVSPTATIQVAIGGETATVAQQVLDSQSIGVTDLHIQVPNVASGLEMVGLQSGTTGIDSIPIWVLGPEGQVSQAIAFGALTSEPLGTPSFTLSAPVSSGLPVSFSSQTGAVCTVSGSSLSLIAVGTCTIQATQAGNATYLAAPAVTQSFQVTQQISAACINTGAATRLGAIQSVLNEALGVSTPVHDLNGAGGVNVVDVQIMANWAVGLGCSASH